MTKSSNDYISQIENAFLIKDEHMFRFGSIGDGGYYLNPKTIEKIDLLFSGGISANLEFEYDLFRFNKELNIIMIDPTISGFTLIAKGLLRLFLKKPQKLRYLYNALIFNFLIREKRCKHLKIWLRSPKRIFDIINGNYNLSNKVLIKLDIEGDEYDFLDEVLKFQDKIEAMVFEFHNMHTHHELVHDFINKCNERFSLTHLNINKSGGFDHNGNPKCIEISLEKRNN